MNEGYEVEVSITYRLFVATRNPSDARRSGLEWLTEAAALIEDEIGQPADALSVTDVVPLEDHH